MIYTFRAPDGETRELDYPIGKAPPWGGEAVVDGKVYYRVPECGAAPKVAANVHSRSHQLPRFYGHNDTPALVKRLGRRPTQREQFEDGRKRAALAGALDTFDSAGRPIATNAGQIQDHIARGRHMGDSLDYD